MTINKEILRLAIPSILANITVPLVGMVDIAVAGHIDGSAQGLAAASFIAAIALGSTLFDLLYWNFAFLRSGTGGLSAQAYGKNDKAECSMVFNRAICIALVSAFLLIAIQWGFVKLAFLFIECTPEVAQLASQYFFIRIWAAPATLCLMAFKGWFIGMQDSVAPMTVDLVVNGVNIAASIILSLGLGSWEGLGFAGVAAGTVCAQYCGLITAILFAIFKYSDVISITPPREWGRLFRGGNTRKFFTMNVDLIVRSFCFIAIYIGYTLIAARYGDVLLATSSILMKLLMIFSYFTDGFAYAGEAMTGKYMGAKNKEMLQRTVKWAFVWSMGIAVLFMGIYALGDRMLLKIMTEDANVVNACNSYLPWLLLMPAIGCAAFTWDGIFLGATASKMIRNSMIAAVIACFSVWTIGIIILGMSPLAEATEMVNGMSQYGKAAIHILMAAYFAHLLARTIYLSVNWRKIKNPV